MTVAQFAETLADAAPGDPVAAESADAFDDLSAAEQQTVVDILNDPAFAAEFLDFTAGGPKPTVTSPVVEQSELYPDAVQYESSVEQDADALLVGAAVASGFAAGRAVVFPANTVQTVRGVSTSVILGVTITRLNIWITFRTGTSGVPRQVLSSGSSASNYNFFIVIENDNLTPYISKGIAVARTVWTGSVLVNGSTFRFDKLDTLKAYNAGLYSHTLVNQ